MGKTISILGINGSLRENSSSHIVMNYLKSIVPPDISFSIYDGIDKLPHFNDAVEVDPAVKDFRDQVRSANAVIICTPEYAFGIPGSLKNALDWTVGSGEFVEKPVALVTASSQGEKGHAALLLVLQAISASVLSDAQTVISFIRSKISGAELSDAHTKFVLGNVVNALIDQCRES